MLRFLTYRAYNRFDTIWIMLTAQFAVLSNWMGFWMALLIGGVVSSAMEAAAAMLNERQSHEG